MKKSILMTVLLLVVVLLSVSACSNSAAPASTDGTDVVKALIDERCSACHSANIVYRANYDQAGWSDVIDNMVQRGAVVSADEKAQMIDWLLAQP